jgi:hypothetical protein
MYQLELPFPAPEQKITPTLPSPRVELDDYEGHYFQMKDYDTRERYLGMGWDDLDG